jgi:hypothetical protein
MKANREIILEHCRNFLAALAFLFIGYVGAAAAQTTSDSTEVGSQASTPAVAPSQGVAKPAQPAIHGGSHDFDFIYRKWRMRNHRL